MRSEIADTVPEGDTVEVPLIRIAHGRSGDKGDDANIGLIARTPISTRRNAAKSPPNASSPTSPTS